MYVLDTNAFYYAADISDLSYDVKKLKELIQNNDVFISSTSIFEFLVKHKDNINVVHQGGRFLKKYHIVIANNILNPIPESFPQDLSNITNTELSKLVSEILKNKVDIESRFISMLFNMCLTSGYHFCLNQEGNEQSITYSETIIKTISNVFIKINSEVFKELLSEGYQTDDCENFIRKCFYNLLAYELFSGLPYIKRSKDIVKDGTTIDIDKWLPKELYDSDVNELVKISSKKTSTKLLNKLAIKYWKSNNDDELKEYISNIVNIISKRVKFSALLNYFEDTLYQIMVHGAAFWKNDLLDAIIMCNIENEHILITYDNGVIEKMERYKETNPQYLKSIETINHLKSN